MEMELMANETWLQRYVRRGKQMLMVLASGCMYATHGMWTAWHNAFASDFEGNMTTVFGTEFGCSEGQMDLVGSLLFLGSLPGFLIAGWLVRLFGRKWTMGGAAIPGLIADCLIAFAANIEMVLAGRLLEGVAFGVMVVAVRSYVVEIVDSELRGAASALEFVMLQSGSISVQILGIYLPWFALPFVNIGILTCYCFLLVPLMPESPSFLVVTQRDEEATVVLRRLRGSTADVPKMLQDLRRQNEIGAASRGLGFLLKLDVLKRVAIVFGLFFISNFTGLLVIKSNTVRMIQSSGVALDEEFWAILVPVFFLAGNVVMMFVLDRLGRRRCLVLSLSLIAAAFAVLGTHSLINSGEEMERIPQMNLVLLQHSNSSVEYTGEAVTPESLWNWIPLLCLMLAAFAQSLGPGPMPWILASEYFPTTIRSQAMSICSVMGSFLAGLSLAFFSPMKALLTDAGLYWSYGAVGLLGIPYTLLLVKETSRVAIG